MRQDTGSCHVDQQDRRNLLDSPLPSRLGAGDTGAYVVAAEACLLTISVPSALQARQPIGKRVSVHARRMTVGRMGRLQASAVDPAALLL
jgi:hypothetical protein